MRTTQTCAVIFILLAGCAPQPRPTTNSAATTAAPVAAPGNSSSPSAGTAAATGASKRITGDGFSLELPAGWEGKLEGGLLVAFVNPATDQITLTAMRQQVAGFSTSEKTLAGLKKGFAPKILKESAIPLAGMAATRTVGTFGEEENSPPETLTYGLLLGDKHVLVITCRTVNPADFARYEPQFDKIVETLTVSPSN